MRGLLLTASAPDKCNNTDNQAEGNGVHAAVNHGHTENKARFIPSNYLLFFSDS